MKTITIRVKGSSLSVEAADKKEMHTKEVQSSMQTMKNAKIIVDPMDVTIHKEDGKITVTIDEHTSNFSLSPNQMKALVSNGFFTGIESSSEGEAISYNFTYKA